MRFLLKVQHVSRLCAKQRFASRVPFNCRDLSIVSVASVGMLRAGRQPAAPRVPPLSLMALILGFSTRPANLARLFQLRERRMLKRIPCPRRTRAGPVQRAGGEKPRATPRNPGARQPIRSPFWFERAEIGDFYASCMDEKQINAAGQAPRPGIRAHRGRWPAWQTSRPNSAAAKLGVGGLFEFGSTQDMKDSTRVIGGPIREVSGCGPRLLHQDRRQIEGDSRAISRSHCQNACAGWDDAPKAAAERRPSWILKPSWPKLPSRTSSGATPKKTYHKMSRPELRTLTPNWSWILFPGDRLHNIDSVDVRRRNFSKREPGTHRISHRRLEIFSAGTL